MNKVASDILGGRLNAYSYATCVIGESRSRILVYSRKSFLFFLDRGRSRRREHWAALGSPLLESLEEVVRATPFAPAIVVRRILVTTTTHNPYRSIETLVCFESRSWIHVSTFSSTSRRAAQDTMRCQGKKGIKGHSIPCQYHVLLIAT